MNRRQKIIISVTGIFLVLLILVGLTYAYFLTRIDGNDAEKSISVTTANLNLKYTDGNGELTFANAIVPGDAIKFLDGTGNTVDSKTFSVTNNGDDTEYVVFIDDVSITYASDVGETIKQGDTTTFESNDFRFTLTCTITSTDTTRNGTSCDGVTDKAFPLKSNSIVVGNDIAKGDVHNYTLTMEYLETGKNQSNDMNKTLTALINIEDINRINPYKDNTDSLAYNIIENARKGTNGTTLVKKPLTIPFNETSKLKININKREELVSLIDIYIEDEYPEEIYISLYSKTMTYDENNGTVNFGDTATKEVISFSSYEYSEELASKLTESYIIVGWRQFYDFDSPSEDIKISYIYDDSFKIFYIEEVTPDDIKGYFIDASMELELNESVLTTTQDQYGTSYYYRGNVENNYVLFNNMCWRAVRIEGDGSVKLIYSGNVGTGATDCSGLSENSALITTYHNADYYYDLQDNLNDWFDTNFKNNNTLTSEGNKVKLDTWCLGIDEKYMYDTKTGNQLNQKELDELYGEPGWLTLEAYSALGKRILLDKEVKLACDFNEGAFNSMIGTLTIDEVILTGINYPGTERYDIFDDGYKNYLRDNVAAGRSYWLLSTVGYDQDFGDYFYVGIENFDGILSNKGINITADTYIRNAGIRPVITLKPSNIISSGDGTQENPYIIG